MAVDRETGIELMKSNLIIVEQKSSERHKRPPDGVTVWQLSLQYNLIAISLPQ